MTLDTTIEIERLERRVAELERLLKPLANLPEDCRNLTCDYYETYLAFGPKELEHEGYHAAERRCTDAQAAVEQHLIQHGDACTADRACATYTALERAATRWERAVRA